MEPTQRAGRSHRRDMSGRHVKVHQQPWARLTNPYPPLKIFSDDQIEAIHLNALRILEEIGMRVLLPEAREAFRKAGAKVDETTLRVHPDKAFLEAALAKAPAEFTLHARNPDRNLQIGGNHVTFATVGGAPNVSDIENGKRHGNWEDFVKMVKLGQSINVLHYHAGYAPEPIDVPVPLRHLKTTEAYATLGDKCFFAFTFTRQRVRDAFEISRLSRGLTEAEAIAKPGFYCIINTNSPLQLDNAMAYGAIGCAELGVPLIVTPFTLEGAMAPVTLPGALSLQHAEALVGIALHQLTRPGAPVAYGGFTSNVDLRSGAPAFGTPEYIKAAIAGGQLARRLKLPYRSSNVNSSNWPDAQAAYEGAMSIWGCLMGGVNMMMHGMGWLEGGLTASYEKYIIDAEMLQIMASSFQPEPVNDDTLALSAIREVGPGGHFFGAQHTLERYEKAFYTPMLSDWRTYEQWTADGALDATKRANKVWKQILADYVAPPLDAGHAAAVSDYVARRVAEGGAPYE